MNAPIWKFSFPGWNRAPGTFSGEDGRMLVGNTPQFWPLSFDTAKPEKLVDHSPSRPQFLMDMKLMYCVLPMDIPDVGMSPVSSGARWMELTSCLDRPDDHTGEPEYLSLGTPCAMC